MTLTPTDPSVVENELDTTDELLDLSVPEDVPTADDPSSRAAARDMDGVGSPWRNSPPS